VILDELPTFSELVSISLFVHGDNCTDLLELWRGFSFALAQDSVATNRELWSLSPGAT
jgi:hypothetical protein